MHCTYTEEAMPFTVRQSQIFPSFSFVYALFLLSDALYRVVPARLQYIPHTPVHSMQYCVQAVRIAQQVTVNITKLIIYYCLLSNRQPDVDFASRMFC